MVLASLSTFAPTFARALAHCTVYILLFIPFFGTYLPICASQITKLKHCFVVVCLFVYITVLSISLGVKAVWLTRKCTGFEIRHLQVEPQLAARFLNHFQTSLILFLLDKSGYVGGNVSGKLKRRELETGEFPKGFF